MQSGIGHLRRALLSLLSLVVLIVLMVQVAVVLLSCI